VGDLSRSYRFRLLLVSQLIGAGPDRCRREHFGDTGKVSASNSRFSETGSDTPIFGHALGSHNFDENFFSSKVTILVSIVDGID
jgi:hypothetical protein